MVARCKLTLCLLWILFVTTGVGAAAEPTSLDGRAWTQAAPRDEVRPRFSVAADPTALSLSAEIEGADGWWQTEVPIEGGQTYHVALQRRLHSVATPHRSCVVRIDWLDAKNQRVPSARPFVKGILEGYKDNQQPDYLDEPPRGADLGDWHSLSGSYLSPPKAVKARIELHLRWSAIGSRVDYRDLKFEVARPVPPRPVKLATVHLQPRGGNPQANREAFVETIDRLFQMLMNERAN